jgi:hypothetical protein
VLRRQLLALLVLVLVIVGVVGYYACWSAGNYYFHGTSIGCFATGTKGSDFPRTLIEWDVKHGSSLDVGIMIKLGENPYFPYIYRGVGFSVFLKNAGAYPQPEVPEDFFALFGLNLTSVMWVARVTPNESVAPEWPPPNGPLLKSTRSFAVDPDHWYTIRILIQGDTHTFYVDGQAIATITAHTEYSRRTSFGVSPSNYACFGDYYVKSFPTPIAFNLLSTILKGKAEEK